MSNPETELRAIWTAQGVPKERQDQLVAEITAKAQPAYLARQFPSELTEVGEQLLVPGCEARLTGPGRGPAQLDLWADAGGKPSP